MPTESNVENPNPTSEDNPVAREVILCNCCEQDLAREGEYTDWEVEGEDYNNLCEACVDQTCCCNSCGEMMWSDGDYRRWTEYGDCYCEECYYERYTYCADCDTEMDNDDAIWRSLGGDATLGADGTLTIGAAKVQAGMLNANVISAQSACTDPVDADELLWSDGGVIKKLGADNLKSYVNRETINGIGDAAAVMVVGLNYANADLSADRTWQLPQSPAVGDVVRVKVAGGLAAGNVLTIQRHGSSANHRIDTTTAITAAIESDNAAVEFVYVAANMWKVF